MFFDADKENLKQYFDLVLPILRVGGIIATDNVLHPKDYHSIMMSFVKYVRAAKRSVSNNSNRAW